jgi:hypothetical protein
MGTKITFTCDDRNQAMVLASCLGKHEWFPRIEDLEVEIDLDGNDDQLGKIRAIACDVMKDFSF